MVTLMTALGLAWLAFILFSTTVRTFFWLGERTPLDRWLEAGAKALLKERSWR